MSIWSKLLEAFLVMRPQWIIALALVFLLSLVFLLCCRNFSWRSRRMSVYGLLVNLPERDILRLAVSVARLCYAAGVAFCFSELLLPHYLMLLLLCLPFDLIRFHPLRLLFSLINGILLSAALFAGDMLISYIREVRPEPGILAIYILLALFIVLYALYLTLRDVQQITLERIGKGGEAGGKVPQTTSEP